MAVVGHTLLPGLLDRLSPAIAGEYHQERHPDPSMKDWQLCTHPPSAVIGEEPEDPNWQGTTLAAYPHSTCLQTQLACENLTTRHYKYLHKVRSALLASASNKNPKQTETSTNVTATLFTTTKEDTCAM